ncbi:MAG: hypothetical protein H7A40_07125 [Chlamydiales bacterium]|nr:hypothetical protein [Chlamydiales bacterium]
MNIPNYLPSSVSEDDLYEAIASFNRFAISCSDRVPTYVKVAAVAIPLILGLGAFLNLFGSQRGQPSPVSPNAAPVALATSSEVSQSKEVSNRSVGSDCEEQEPIEILVTYESDEDEPPSESPEQSNKGISNIANAVLVQEGESVSSCPASNASTKETLWNSALGLPQTKFYNALRNCLSYSSGGAAKETFWNSVRLLPKITVFNALRNCLPDSSGADFETFAKECLNWSAISTRGDGTCALHALIGRRQNNEYSYPGGPKKAREAFAEKLKKSPQIHSVKEQYCQIIKRLIQDNSGPLASAENRAVARKFIGYLISSNGFQDVENYRTNAPMMQQVMRDDLFSNINTNRSSLPDNMIDLILDQMPEHKAALNNAANKAQYLLRARQKFKAENIESSDLSRYILNCLPDFIDEWKKQDPLKISGMDPDKFLASYLSVCSFFQKEGERSIEKFALRSEVIEAYCKIMVESKPAYWLDDDELKLAALVFGGICLYIIDPYGIHDPVGEGEDVYIHSSGTHYSRCALTEKMQEQMVSQYSSGEDSSSEEGSEVSMEGSLPQSPSSSPEVAPRKKSDDFEKIKKKWEELRSSTRDAVSKICGQTGVELMNECDEFLQNFGEDAFILRLVSSIRAVRLNPAKFSLSPLENSAVGIRQQQDIPGDFNCVFHSIAQAYEKSSGNTLQNEKMLAHESLRKDVVAYLRKNQNESLVNQYLSAGSRDERTCRILALENDLKTYELLAGESEEYNEYILQTKEEIEKYKRDGQVAFDSYLNNMERLQVMGGVAEIYAAAQLLQAPILVCYYNQYCPDRTEDVYIFGKNFMNNTPENNVLVIEYEVARQHYNNRVLNPEERKTLLDRASVYNPSFGFDGR